ncbi:hypothetical protein [Blattabacterium cuenoti]|uniref:hypothetical protein n=1 Tax=Blattabacterium cuenoti TaxID=1653831 RepID=UPI00163CF356|nr:hypothetical protein [Blattabacterium cuenoti]
MKERYLLLYKSYLISLLFVFIYILIIYNIINIQNNSEKYKKHVIKRINDFKSFRSSLK